MRTFQFVNLFDRILMVVTLFFLLLSCNGEKEKSPSELAEEFKNKRIYVYDTLTDDLPLDTAFCIQPSEFIILYLGEIKDSIFLNYKHFVHFQRTFDPTQNLQPAKKSLEITVDTSKIIATITRKMISERDKNGEEILKELKIYLKSYPVIIKNVSNYTIEIAYAEHIPMIMEAKDSLGNWLPIEKHFSYMCGTGMMYPFLKKDQLLITSCRLFNGNFKTKIRLKFGYEIFAYSNEFTGTIEYSQFTECSEIE